MENTTCKPTWLSYERFERMSESSFPSQFEIKGNLHRLVTIAVISAIVLTVTATQTCEAQMIPRRIDTYYLQRHAPTPPKLSLPGVLTIEHATSPVTGQPTKIIQKQTRPQPAAGSVQQTRGGTMTQTNWPGRAQGSLQSTRGGTATQLSGPEPAWGSLLNKRPGTR